VLWRALGPSLLEPAPVPAGRLAGSPFALSGFHPSGGLRHVAFHGGRASRGLLPRVLVHTACSFRLVLPRWLCRFSYGSVEASAISVSSGKPVHAAGMSWGHWGRWGSRMGQLLQGCRHSPGSAKAPLQPEPLLRLSLGGAAAMIIVEGKDITECGD